MISFTITESPDQQFSTIIGQKRMTIRLWYSTYSERWSMDVSIDGTPVLHGRRIVTGIDMLATFNFDIGVMFAVSENNDPPGRTQLSEGLVKIYQATKDEVSAAMAS